MKKILSKIFSISGMVATSDYSLLVGKETTKNFIQIFLINVSNFFLFTVRFFKETFTSPYEFNELLRQCYLIGYKSLPLVGTTGLILGLVLTIQSRPTLAVFGVQSWLPAMVSVSIVREIGPVITALICAGKIGSSIGAELASMKVTEQIDAMEVSGINPFKYIVATRVLATTLMIPILTMFSDAIAMFGSFVGVNIKDDVSFQLYISQAMEQISFTDIIQSVVKTIFFGLAIGLIATYKGYNSNKGTEGVGQAANQSVVLGSLMVFIIDMLAVQITSLFL